MQPYSTALVSPYVKRPRPAANVLLPAVLPADVVAPAPLLALAAGVPLVLPLFMNLEKNEPCAGAGVVVVVPAAAGAWVVVAVAPAAACGVAAAPAR